METNNREAQNIDRLHLHYRDDGLLYKKHAKTPFSGIAEAVSYTHLTLPTT